MTLNYTFHIWTLFICFYGVVIEMGCFYVEIMRELDLLSGIRTFSDSQL